MEYACHEGNVNLEFTLSAARAKEREEDGERKGSSSQARFRKDRLGEKEMKDRNLLMFMLVAMVMISAGPSGERASLVCGRIRCE